MKTARLKLAFARLVVRRLPRSLWMRRFGFIWLLILSGGMASADDAVGLVADRDELDRTTWSSEVQAQQYERRIVALWDRLRNSVDQLQVLTQFPFESIRLGQPNQSESLELGIRQINFAQPTTSMTHEHWTQLVRSVRQQGFRLLQSEWHHSAFSPGDAAGTSAESTIDFVLHVVQRAIGPNAQPSPSDPRLILRGKLRIIWQPAAKPGSLGTVQTAGQNDVVFAGANAKTISVDQLQLLTRTGTPAFEKAFTYSRRQHDVASAHPILLYDLDGNDFPEIVIPRWNRVYWNEGKGRFREGKLLPTDDRHAEAGIIADINGDARPISSRLTNVEGSSLSLAKKMERLIGPR